jgi:hypothetical protein
VAVRTGLRLTAMITSTAKSGDAALLTAAAVK